MGIWKINREFCEGCGACDEACDFQMVVMIIEKAMKCDLCGGEPKCARYCLTGALVWERC
jgi:carbon-monoxide dehydrogenase iron sulfur subunit